MSNEKEVKETCVVMADGCGSIKQLQKNATVLGLMFRLEVTQHHTYENPTVTFKFYKAEAGVELDTKDEHFSTTDYQEAFNYLENISHYLNLTNK